jgi:hypothetical protein
VTLACEQEMKKDAELKRLAEIIEAQNRKAGKQRTLLKESQ